MSLKTSQKPASFVTPPPPHVILAIFFLGIFLLFACDDFNRPLSPYIHEATKSYTITFDSMGGTPVSPIKLYGPNKNRPIYAPTTPTTTAGGLTGNRFRGWYTDNTFTTAWNFAEDIVTDDITLYAEWGYRVGDTGPAGGTIFYRDEDGFDVEGYGSLDEDGYFPGYRAHYLEVAPRGWNGTDAHLRTYFMSYGSAYAATDVKTTDDELGTGRKNTIKFYIYASEDALAVKACINYNGGGKADWFLPSIDELRLLYTMEAGNTWDIRHFSSSETTLSVSMMTINPTGTDGNLNKDGGFGIVRPIRAF